MSAPISLGGAGLTPSLNSDREAQANRIPSGKGANALSAPTTPGKRLPVVDRSKVDPNTLKAAEGMEAMFLDYMLQQMRKTVPKSEMDLESPATEIYRGMQDSEVAQKAARAGGIGLADQIVAYLEAQRYTGQQGMRPMMAKSPAAKPEDKTEAVNASPQKQIPSAVSRSTGGTHEGQQ